MTSHVFICIASATLILLIYGLNECIRLPFYILLHHVIAHVLYMLEYIHVFIYV
jgi:hypothetical protein